MIALEGELKIENLKQALERTVRKYEILRTVFRKQSGIKLPFQVIEDQTAFRWEVGANRDVEEWLARERESPWDFEKGPALHALLSSRGSEFRLAFTIAALCADAASLKNLCRELTAFGANGIERFSRSSLGADCGEPNWWVWKRKISKFARNTG